MIDAHNPLFAPSRRQMLQSAGTGLGLLGLAAMSEGAIGTAAASEGAARGPVGVSPLAPKAGHFKPKAKRIIHLFMGGGPSQVDTFDPKPMLDKMHGQKPPAADLKTERRTGTLLRSPFKFTPSGKSGVPVSELFPEVAKRIDDICVIRSMHTNVPNHEPSLLMMNCGNTQPIRPSMGSWLLYGLGSENQNLPGFVVLCPGKPTVGPQLWSNSFLPGIYQGCHINNSKMDPKTVIRDLHNNELSSVAQRRQLDIIQRMNALHAEQRSRDAQLEGRIQSLEMAFRMQTAATEAFDLATEKPAVRELYGKGEFADACITARRLIERDVRMVQVYHGSGQPWDAHGGLEKNHRDLAQRSDQAIGGLLSDLKSRGLLEDTIVMWGGEFGRTPTSEGSDGRDHNNHGFCVWLAGGGIKGGMTYGGTDDFGFASVDKPVHVHDLHATLLHQLGLDHTKLTFRYSGRDFRLTDVHGEVVKEILA